MKIDPDGCPQFDEKEVGLWLVPLNTVNKQLSDWFESLDRVCVRDGIPFRLWSGDLEDPDVMVARLTKPVPIVRDSLEQVAKDLVEWPRVGASAELFKIVDRARKLLDKGE